MTSIQGEGFPKSFRLLNSKDFQFKACKRFETKDFRILFTQGKGRLGISIPKKSLKSAAARNRIRRLIREGFRINHNKFNELDVHFIGHRSLKEAWKGMGLSDIEGRLHAFGRYAERRLSKQRAQTT